MADDGGAPKQVRISKLTPDEERVRAALEEKRNGILRILEHMQWEQQLNLLVHVTTFVIARWIQRGERGKAFKFFCEQLSKRLSAET